MNEYCKDQKELFELKLKEMKADDPKDTELEVEETEQETKTVESTKKTNKEHKKNNKII